MRILIAIVVMLAACKEADPDVEDPHARELARNVQRDYVRMMCTCKDASCTGRVDGKRQAWRASIFPRYRTPEWAEPEMHTQYDKCAATAKGAAEVAP